MKALQPGSLKNPIILAIMASFSSRSRSWNSLSGGRFDLSPIALPDYLLKALEPHTL